MSAGTIIEIHEFSTGINVIKTPDGGWVSAGFTGQYMNITCQVPHAIERAIRNDEFAVTEGAYSEQPALIGRMIPDEERRMNWSVVAIVNKGRDDSSRSGSFYRYFLCGEDDGIWKILTWIDNYQREQGHLPVFNPFEKPQSFHTWTVPASQKPPLREETKALLEEDSIPIVVPGNHPNQPRIIHEMAERVAEKTGQPVSWAVNVEALKKPHRFLVVYPASDRADEILQQAKRNVAALLPVVADEQSIKKAIQSLTNSQTIKPEAVRLLAKALMNERITPEHWLQWFDREGANKLQNVRSEPANRLLALRAIVVPQTLPEYLLWLGATPKNAKEKDLETSLRFQQKVSANLPQSPEFDRFQQVLSTRLADGIAWVVPDVLSRKIAPQWLAWLFLEVQSLWNLQGEAFVREIASDLERLQGYYSQPQQIRAQSQSPLLNYGKENYGKDLWSGVREYWRTGRGGSPRKFYSEYDSFAELFQELGSYRFASYFYQVSQGKVPNDVFIEAFPSDRMGSYTSFLGLKLYRDVPLHEQFIVALIDLFRWIGDILVHIKTPLGITVFLTLFSFALGMVVGRDFNVEGFKDRLSGILPAPEPASNSPTPEPTEPPTTTTPNPGEGATSSQPSPSASTDPAPSPARGASPSISQEASQPPIPEELKAAAIAEFPSTQLALEEIIRTLKRDFGDEKDSEIKQEIKNVLGIDINFSEVLQNEFSEDLQQNGGSGTEELIRGRDYLIQAIYSFQNSYYPGAAYGYMKPGAQSPRRLEQLVGEKLARRFQ